MELDSRTTTSAEETTAAGRELAATLRAGDLVLLEGPLGSGKTTFVQGIAQGLGALGPVISPSFVLVNEYHVGNRQQGEGRRLPPPDSQLATQKLLRHLDLYRLPDPAVDLDRIGFPELLNDPSAITVIEWADRIPAEAFGGGGPAGRTFHVRFGHGTTEGERTIEIAYP